MGVGVKVGLGVMVGVGVKVGLGVMVGVGVKVGPNNCPGPHPDITKLIIKNTKIAKVRCFVFISLLHYDGRTRRLLKCAA